MSRFLPALFLASACVLAPGARAADASKLPVAANQQVDFVKDIKPLFEASCVKCHAKGNTKGGFSLETRGGFLEGGDTGKAADLGHSAESLIVELVAGLDPENVMPKKGSRWTAEQVGLLRAWIDQGAQWPADITFARPQPRNLHARTVAVPETAEANPLDRLLDPYLQQHGVASAAVDDRVFARRVYLDTIGLLPSPAQLDSFVADASPTKRAELVRQLLGDRRGYADHWLSFWNDLLRNDYRGTGFIDGGRKQISEWLFDALLANKPYDKFVAELISPGEKQEGFTAGIIWRGNVAAAMSQPMQAAQSVSQVFLGINLKCASCHDSFVSDWSLADAYGMAAVFAEQPLELVRCDKPTGQKAALRFLYPELGAMSADAARPERMQRLAALMTQPQNGRLSRTIVNRLWSRLLGRGLVEPLDDMDKPAWSADVLDWLATDLEQHGYDLKHTLETIMTSSAYALPPVEAASEKTEYVFRGPLVRRLSAEQFADAISTLTGEWAGLPSTLEFDFTGGGVDGDITLPKWIWTGEPMSAASQRSAWRDAKGKADAAQAAAVEAQKRVEAGAPEAAAAVAAAQKAAEEAAASAKWATTFAGEIRHRIVFSKSFTLAEKPAQAYASLLGTQNFEVAVNGQLIGPRMINGFMNGRARLYDFTHALQAGENVIAISIDSHTEKAMNDTERKDFPASTQHLNKTSGVACYIACRTGEGGRSRLEIISDESWKARRAPQGNWLDPNLAVADWAAVSLLAPGVGPVDEGPGLEPLRRQDFANLPAYMDTALRATCSTAARAERIRASMLAADGLQVALDRPNREIVITARANAATTLQALELTNGSTLAGRVERAGAALAQPGTVPAQLADRLYREALGRSPTEPERTIAAEMLGSTVSAAGSSDLLWSLLMLPEFQFIR